MTRARETSLLHRLAALCARRPWWVIAGWAGLIAVLQLAAATLGGATYKDTFSLPRTESATVASVLSDAGLDSQNGASGTVVLHARTGVLVSAPRGSLAALTRLCDTGAEVLTIRSPWRTIDCAHRVSTAGDAALLDRSATIALVSVAWRSGHYEAHLFSTVYDRLRPMRSTSLQVEFTGNAFVAEGQRSQGFPPFAFGFLAALVLLLLAFRTAAATVLPLASAIAALGAGLGLIGVLTHAMSVSTITSQLTELMVLGVGVDYALFVVTRHRRNVRSGMDVAESIAVSLATSGRAVVFAGGTVCIALLGLIALGVTFFDGMALAAAVAVGLTMAASLTLLPAALALLGLRVLPRTQRRAVLRGEFADGMSAGVWSRWSRVVAAHRIALLLCGAAIVGTLALPFGALRLGQGDQGNDPSGTTTRAGYDLIARGFGVGYNSTLEAVIDGPGAAEPAFVAHVASDLSATPGVDGSSIHPIPIGRSLSIVAFKSVASPQDEQTYALVRHLRSQTLPPVYAGTANQIYIYGATAIQVDFAAVLTAKMGLFVAAVVGLSFLLLTVAFRSVVIPLTAAVMNLLAAAASFGVVVAIFQWGWGSEALDIGRGGPVDAWAPVMFFAILFGLSMDYQVFLVSRIHEEWQRTGDADRAVTVGQTETGGIITVAALIMIAVFGGFVLGDLRAIKLFGAGLASAVFIDAFVLRTVMVPALMHVLGRANWYLPAWLDRVLPRVAVVSEERHSVSSHDLTLAGR